MWTRENDPRHRETQTFEWRKKKLQSKTTRAEKKNDRGSLKIMMSAIRHLKEKVWF